MTAILSFVVIRKAATAFWHLEGGATGKRGQRIGGSIQTASLRLAAMRCPAKCRGAENDVGGSQAPCSPRL